MVRIHLKVLVIILFFILVSSEAYAINLGSVAKNNFAKISVDESAKFKMLFWSFENEAHIVKLSIKESPEGWTIIIDPDEFILNKTIGEEYISLPYTNENIKAKVVNLFAKPSSNSKPGKYLVSIKSEIRLPQNEKNAITIVPGTILNFVVELEGFDITESNVIIESEENKIDFSENGFEANGENLIISNSKNERIMNKNYFYFLIVFLVIVISIIIYKK